MTNKRSNGKSDKGIIPPLVTNPGRDEAKNGEDLIREFVKLLGRHAADDDFAAGMFESTAGTPQTGIL